MQKLDRTTPDLTKENIDKLAGLFPAVVTEHEGEDGAVVRMVDFDLLRQALAGDLVEGADERYRLDWPGKRASLLKANTPIAKTLRPDRESSVDFDTTQNVFIEGDNFEALKVLQESYLGKVKMIYIDPPYNTGKDFVYSDNFTQDKAEYDEEIEAVDEEGNKMFKENTRTNPRFHSDWLSMIYERLIIARDLLRDDGVIFISIDDNEVHNLRKVCDEIFGEENFVTTLVRKSKTANNKTTDGTNSQHEYVLTYARKHDNVYLRGKKKTFDNYTNPDNDPSGEWISDNPTANLDGRKKKNDFEIVNPLTHKVDLPPRGRHWNFSKEDFEKLVSSGKIIFKTEHLENERGFILKRYKKDIKSAYHTVNTLGLTSNEYINEVATNDIYDLFEIKAFDYTKPTILVRDLVRQAVSENDLVLDFFSGSATTAHAVMAQNAEDGGNRKYIMVQLPEETPEDSEARKAGYHTIAEIGRERIRRAGAKIRADYADKLKERATLLDTGFRAYRVDDTVFKDVERHPSELKQADIFGLADNIKPDRTPEDLLTQVMLQLGLTLDMPIDVKEFEGKKVFYVAENALVACFDTVVPMALVDEVAKCSPLKAVFRDSSFGSDEDLINAETRLKRLSPDTTLTVL